ncbi:UBX domain-containing protein 10-like [Clavelina lepadiformis]|uniref:UBX domain-containing protein 10-like n=1 Tax=Clavelina lepadiformis TaxID=159417 RepID=UPI00404334AA
MYKPTRPKSAKGKTRAPRSPAQRSVTQNQRQDPGTENKSTTTTRVATSRSTITSSYAAHHGTTSRRNEPDQQTKGHRNRQAEDDDVVDAKRMRSPVLNLPEINRPTSSLSKYRILPSISGTSTPSGGDNSASLYHSGHDMELLTEQAQQMILDSTLHLPRDATSPTSNKRKTEKSVEPKQKRKKVFQTQSVFAPAGKPLTKEHPRPNVPREPGPNEERLLLAIKLPDGARVERHFKPNTKLSGVLAYSYSQYPVLPISQSDIYRMDKVPKVLLEDLDLSLEEVGIKNRTVLYIEEKESF